MRKTLLIAFLILLPIKSVAQIIVQLSFDKHKKTLMLTLKNETKNNFNLAPPVSSDYFTVRGSYIDVKFKDKKNNVIYQRSLFVFDGLKPKEYFGKGRYLFEYEKKEYVYKLHQWYKKDFHMIDVLVQIEARNISNRNDVYTEKIQASFP